MRCTFYVDGDLLEPWEEELLPGQPRLGSVMVRHDFVWVVQRVTFVRLPGVGQTVRLAALRPALSKAHLITPSHRVGV
jgi:hypothetical protein